MKLLLGFVLMIAGAVLGLYVGVWLCFIGGIVDVIQAIRADDLIAMDVAIGVTKFVCSSIAGWIAALCLIIPGLTLAEDA